MKRFFSFFILTLVILLSSCVEDKTSLMQEEIAINFNLNADNFTRAYGDGTTVRDLEYAIFSKADFDSGDYSSPVGETHKEIKNAFSATSQTAVVTEKLGLDHEYVAVFWADAEDDNYNIDWTTLTMEIEDTDKLSTQDEAADAFYAVYKFTANAEHVDSSVYLKRPFAQLNIATSNIESAVDVLKAELTQTAVLANTCTKLNLASGVASEVAEHLFNFAAIPTEETAISDGTNTFTRIATCYILVNNNSTENITVYLNNDSYYRTFSDIKLYRNLRTNIVGNVFSGTTEVEGVESPKNVSHKDGKFRVQLTWEAPSVAGYTTRITWTQEGEEKSKDVDASLGEVIIDGLPEGDHTFTLINIDSNNVASYETMEIAHAFGEFATRTLGNTAYDADTKTATLTFKKTVTTLENPSPWAEGKETVIKYTNINGTETTKTIANADQRVVCDNIGVGVTISYYTAYESDNGCELLDDMNGPTLTTVTTTGFDVKVMTWNVCNAYDYITIDTNNDGNKDKEVGYPWYIRRAAIAKQILDADPDIIMLQEMNCVSVVKFFRDILQLINGNGANLGSNDSYYNGSSWPVETYNGNTYYGLMIKRGSTSLIESNDEGNAIIYKKSKFTDVTSTYDTNKPVGYFWLSNTPNQESIYPDANFKRVCLYKRLRHNATGKEFVVACTHIDNSHFADDGPEYAVMNGQVQILINNLRANTLTTDEQRAYEDTAEADKIGRCPVIIGGDMNANPSYSSIQRFGYNKAGGYRTIANPEGNTTADNDFADTYNVAINGAATILYPLGTTNRSTMVDIKYNSSTDTTGATQNGAIWDYIFMRWGNTVKSYQIHRPTLTSFTYGGVTYSDVLLSDHNAVSAVINLQYYE